MYFFCLNGDYGNSSKLFLLFVKGNKKFVKRNSKNSLSFFKKLKEFCPTLQELFKKARNLSDYSHTFPFLSVG